MSQSSENYYIKTCADCKEIMTPSENICYCGGPVKLIRCNEEKYLRSKDYGIRKLLSKLGKLEK